MRREAEDFLGHSRADAPGIDELAVIRVVAEQERAKMRPRAFRVGPADHHEFLPVDALSLAPQAAIARRVRCRGCL